MKGLLLRLGAIGFLSLAVAGAPPEQGSGGTGSGAEGAGQGSHAGRRRLGGPNGGPGRGFGAGVRPMGRTGKGKGAAARAGKGGKAGAQGAGGRDITKNPLVVRGNAFLERGNAGAAVASFRKQLQTSPDSVAVHVGLAKALARTGHCEEALTHFWPYVGTTPFGGEAALAASTCSSRLGLLEDAIYFDRLAVDLDPTSARALTNLALDLASAGDVSGTEATLDDLLFLRPDTDASTYARAVLALRAGDIDGFDRIAFAWEQRDGGSLDLRRLQAQAWLDLDDPASALETLANVRRLRNGQQVRHLRAEAYRRGGFPDQAAEYLEDRPQAALEGVESDAIRVRVLADLGDFEGAHALLAAYDTFAGPELAASAWYLARLEGRTADLPDLAATYDMLRQSPLRSLEQLIPWTERDRP